MIFSGKRCLKKFSDQFLADKKGVHSRQIASDKLIPFFRRLRLRQELRCQNSFNNTT